MGTDVVHSPSSNQKLAPELFSSSRGEDQFLLRDGSGGGVSGRSMGTGEAVNGKAWWKEMRVFSPEYYAVCAIGGMLSAGTTHLAITPLDVLKVNMQVIDRVTEKKIASFPRFS